jgi:hypothetical protein
MKKKILPALFTYLLLVFASNVNAQGGTLPLNGSVNGNLATSTIDVWNVTTNADGLLRLTFTTVSPADLDITLYDNDGTTTLSGTTQSFNNSTVTFNTDGLSPGIYHVKITPHFSTDFGNYTLSDSLFTTSLANDAEPNGTTATAIAVPVNGSKTGHLGYYYNNQRDTTDWYKITTTADGLLRVYLATERGSVYSNNFLEADITLYDNDGTTALGSVQVYDGVGNPTTKFITVDGLAPGTYFIKVISRTTADIEDYTIFDSLFTPPLANDVEPNGTAATAIDLPLAGSKTGHIGYYYNNQRDTTDWYKITTTADGLLRVYLATERGSVYSNNFLEVDITLYDNDATTALGAVQVYDGAVGDPASKFITVDGLAPGTYFIKVKSRTTANFEDYTIFDSLFTPPLANDVEPNGTAAKAIDFPVNSNTKGHAGYYYNNQRDTSDWYKLTTTTTGPLYVYLNSSRGSIYSNNFLDMRITFYSSDGITQLGSVEVYDNAVGNPAVDSLFFPTLAAGTYYIKVNNNNNPALFSDYSLSNSVTQGNLPVTFLNFDGKLIDNKAELTWSTATEFNNKGFEVQKSADGQSFAGIGFVEGNGTSSLVNNYNYTDIKVLSGSNYYRLKQVDIDGHFDYSSTIRLDFKHFDWAIFGNPISTNSWIQLQVAKTSNIAFQVYTIDGRLVKTINKGTVSEGTYSVPLNLGNAAAGIYIVKLVSDNQIFSKQIIK